MPTVNTGYSCLGRTTFWQKVGDGTFVFLNPDSQNEEHSTCTWYSVNEILTSAGTGWFTLLDGAGASLGKRSFGGYCDVTGGCKAQDGITLSRQQIEKLAAGGKAKLSIHLPSLDRVETFDIDATALVQVSDYFKSVEKYPDIRYPEPTIQEQNCCGTGQIS